ncbi:MAG: hypothetical protein WCT39_00800 [Candidatus Margulisiibacteriota bacterium]
MTIKKLTQWILAIICLVLLASYFFKIADVPFVRLDDGELMQLSETFANRGFLGSQMMDTGHKEHLYYHVHPPLYYLINGLVFRLGGIGVLQSRIVSLLSALAVLLLTFMLASKMLKLSLSLDNFLILTVLFLSTPMFFVLARSNRPEMLTLAMILSAILAYFYFRETKKAGFLILSALLSGMAMITQAYASFVFIYLFCLQYFDHRRNWRLLALFVALFALPLVFYALWISRDFPAFVYQTFIARHAISNLGLASLLNRYCYFFSSFENVATTLFFLASLSLFFLLKFKSNDKPIAFIFSPPLLIKICFLAVFIFIPVINKYYYVILLPFIYLFFLFIQSQNKSRWFSALFCLYLAINLLGLTAFWQKYKDFDYPAYGRRIAKKLPAPGNFSILASPSLYPALRHYHFYAFNNGSILKPGQTYAGLKTRLAQLEIKYLIYQEYNEKLYAGLDYLTQFIKKDCHLIAKVQDPYYGSEGVKKDNYIKIFLVIIR